MAPKMKVVVALAVVVLGGIIGLSAQTQVAGGSLADVATEIRLLRESLDANSKTQTLASVMATQQSRIQPLSAELLLIRKELDSVTADLRNARQDEASFQPSSNAAADAAARSMRTAEIKASETREAVLRARESDLSSRLLNEEAVWSQLMTQLQQAIRR